ncbi:MAG: sigma-70 family RNA polymerase sigma factor [Deltaproteobacteria bacterium]|nr:MAG: sigma-70 family RNA polymerase sigma factor [Deltaproteobacteria bacterium]
MAEVTELLVRSREGDEAARNALAPLVYDELKQLAARHMRREHSAHSVQATQLVSDAFMRLVGQARVDWESRSHFYALASRVMRQILVEHARARGRQKRGDGATHVSFDDVVTVSTDRDEDILAIEDALEALEAIDPRQAEIVTMRFYGGMSMQAVADALGMSKRSADREWALIKAWLRRELAQ